MANLQPAISHRRTPRPVTCVRRDNGRKHRGTHRGLTSQWQQFSWERRTRSRVLEPQRDLESTSTLRFPGAKRALQQRNRRREVEATGGGKPRCFGWTLSGHVPTFALRTLVLGAFTTVVFGPLGSVGLCVCSPIQCRPGRPGRTRTCRAFWLGLCHFRRLGRVLCQPPWKDSNASMFSYCPSENPTRRLGRPLFF